MRMGWRMTILCERMGAAVLSFDHFSCMIDDFDAWMISIDYVV